MTRRSRASRLRAALEPSLAAHGGRLLRERAGSPLCRPIQWVYAFELKRIADREERMTAHLSLRRLLLAAAAFAFGLAMPGDAAELNPAALTYKLPDQIKWNPPSAAGSKNSVLVGDPSQDWPYHVLYRC